MAGYFAAGGVPDRQQLGGKGGGSGHALVIAAELDEEEDEEAGHGADGGDVEEVLDVAVPCSVEIIVAGAGGGGRGRRECVIHCD